MGAPGRPEKLKVWHDNERFLKVPDAYKKAGLQMINFPTNSADLNPIENVWSKLQRDLAKREQEDLAQGRHLTVAQFRQRAGQILQTYAEVQPGESQSYLAKLVAGMPARLQKCKSNRYGRCGK